MKPFTQYIIYWLICLLVASVIFQFAHLTGFLVQWPLYGIGASIAFVGTYDVIAELVRLYRARGGQK